MALLIGNMPRKNQPSQKKIQDDLVYLHHLETCILTFSVTLMAAGLTLYLSIKDNNDLRAIYFMLFAFSAFFSLNHLKAIIYRNITPRINAFIWDIGFIIFVVMIYLLSILSRIIWSVFEIEPSSALGFIVGFIPYIIITIIGVIKIRKFIERKIKPKIRKIFPALSYNKHLDNPFVGKEISNKNENKNGGIKNE